MSRPADEATAETRTRFRVTLSDDGRPGPIEERIGRRLVRLVDPRTAEGLRLLLSGTVELVAPGGECWGRIHPAEAYRRLRAKLERRLSDPDGCEDADAVREGIERLDAWHAEVSPEKLCRP